MANLYPEHGMKSARRAKRLYSLGRETYNNPIYLRLLQLAQKRNIFVAINPYGKELRNKRGKAAGRITYYDDGRITIILDPHLSLYRMTTTFCHELGHYMLHPDLDSGRYKNNAKYWYTKEAEADYFSDRLMGLLLLKYAKAS